MAVILNASTSSGFIQTADTSGELVVQSNGTTQLTIDSTGVYGQVERGTAVNAATGSPTSIDFTNIPSWVKRIIFMYSGVSSSSTGAYILQIGSSGTPVTTGYVGAIGGINGGTTASQTFSTGFNINRTTIAANNYQGIVTLVNVTGNIWTESSNSADNTTILTNGAGSITLSGTLNILRLTTLTGTDTFDAGTVNILYEG
jgi:hypothetical protein